jgi:predicted N-acyltransferase
LVGIGLQQARYVHDCKGEFPFDWLWRHICARFGIAI